jgi:hypothetical protein
MLTGNCDKGCDSHKIIFVGISINVSGPNAAYGIVALLICIIIHHVIVYSSTTPV